MVGGEDQGLDLFVVGVAGVLAAVFFAPLALIAQLAVLGMAVAVEVGSAAVRTTSGLGKHRLILPSQTKLSQPLVKGRRFCTPESIT